MISEADILLLNQFSISDYGGSDGLEGSEFAVISNKRPFQTFDGKDFYLTPIEKTAALGESLIINHPFVDGNKRNALLAMLALQTEYHVEISINNNELYEFVIQMSAGKKFEDIVRG